jgi:hypothetical protein
LKKVFSFLFVLFVAVAIMLNACKKDPLEPIDIPKPAPDSTQTPSPGPNPSPDTTGVSVDLSTVPYTNLSDYRFFTGALKDQMPAEGVIPYKPASSLFTDYALKKRFVWIPPNRKANYVADKEILNLPIGSVLIKTFYYDNVQPSGETKILETRLMIRKGTGWIFAEYVWNDEQTDATLQMNGSFTPIAWLQNGSPKSTTYRIPSETECLTCHKTNNNPIPIGIKPQNLNIAYPYTSGSENQLQHWVAKGILKNNLQDLVEPIFCIYPLALLLNKANVIDALKLLSEFPDYFIISGGEMDINPLRHTFKNGNQGVEILFPE